MAEIHVLQLGEENWNSVYELPLGVQLDFVVSFKKVPKQQYDLFFLDRIPFEEEIDLLFHAIKAYTLFITEKVFTDERAGKGRVKWLFCSRKAKYINTRDIQDFLQQEAKYFYPRPYGEKFNLRDLTISHEFSGKVKWDGNYRLILEGEFGESFQQAAFWRYNTLISREQTIDLWLEYHKDSNVEIILTIDKFENGSISHILEHREFDEKELKNIIQIHGGREGGWFSISLKAKGSGYLQIIALHNRISRGTHGYFLPGGERYVAANREEVFCYFEPNDLKPPLNVYFSGYKTLQGFEGYYMMKSMGCPFLLLAEPRLEGGGFYMGTPEYERLYVEIIEKYMGELGFSANQVILSGLSMGTFGALYYGCDIRPHAMIIGKPLASIGNVARNEKYLRPGGFPTSLDVLRCQCRGLDTEAIQKLNNKFWDKFDKTDWGNSKFAISYMLEDDYDADAYHTLLEHLESAGTQVYGKGIHGRHNDNTNAIISWFVMQYKKILREDFGREIEDR